LELPFEKINVITLPQIFAMMPPPLLALIVVHVATFSLDHNKVLLEFGTIECLRLESQT
jgi:hypothetical protein